MAISYVFVRMRKEDFEKIIKEKKVPMEQDLKEIMGKPIKIKTTQLFKIAANCTWDLGQNYQNNLFHAIKIKKGKLNL
jgi:hypothetical protein